MSGLGDSADRSHDPAQALLGPIDGDRDMPRDARLDRVRLWRGIFE